MPIPESAGQTPNPGLCFLNIQDISGLIERREVSPIEVVDAYLERIDRLDSTLGAYSTVLKLRAREDAAAAEREIASDGCTGPLHGVPLALKDNCYTKGVRTTAGSLVLEDFVPDYDATVAVRLRQAGAILLGKTNLHEFAMGPTTPYRFGITRNPWDLERTTGASSGGSAVAVAASLCAASIGTDTGGSVRLPAAFCGVVGLKPTYGRVSRHGIVPLAWSLDCAGPLTKSVVDAALIMNAISGYDPDDPASSELPVPDFLSTLGGDLRDVRVGIPSHFFFERLDPEVESAVRAALETLERLGASLTEVVIPDAEHAHASATVITYAEASSFHMEWLRDRADRYGGHARTRLEAGSTLLATDYLKAQRVRTALLRESRQAMEHVDVLVTPTTPRPAYSTTSPVPKSDGAEAAWVGDNRLTRLFSVLGWPAISVPCGFSSEGLPIGLQIAGKPFAEELILRVAYAYEQETEWHLRRPRMT